MRGGFSELAKAPIGLTQLSMAGARKRHSRTAGCHGAFLPDDFPRVLLSYTGCLLWNSHYSRGRNHGATNSSKA